ncbi:MAG: exopolyphosphatase [Thermodesulfobacteriota bacterium]
MRLLTRADFDGLACAALLTDLGVVDDYHFVHPKDLQDGKVPVSENDVLANVPYVPGCGLWFDHHTSEEERVARFRRFEFKGVARPAPSCARVIYDYYGGGWKLAKFDQSGLMEGVDKADSGRWTKEEILAPRGWVLLSFIMDPRTGLEYSGGYRISLPALTLKLIDLVRRRSIEEVIEDPDVKERADRYFEHEKPYVEMILQHSRTDGNVIIIDLRDVDQRLAGNRFVEYGLYPGQNVSVRVMWGKDQQNVVITVGHSILTRTCRTDVGSLCLKYGGGGHRKVGTCQVPLKEAARTFLEILKILKETG